ncbi:sugar ABC transporter substrate-binding protein [Arthrobacter pityocampae]|uniref:Sugar ABC transporter substrate-binding protein n=1 Tax=Arthrobacter pityocampae TaxID=547334 RepID=A0A2S5IXZ6_9MICC|nr:extracellular solute-binding protein [Arthrobacter pityocampae]PPB49415.1 sugar ABC transporter substrate-binding protein [Arthrobacter pityocampae]
MQHLASRRPSGAAARSTTKTFLSAAAVLSALTLAGCGAGGGGTASADDAESLTVLVEAGGKAELTGVAEKFTEETGTDVTFVELPYEGLYNRLNTEFSSGSTSFDVAALDAIWLSTFADAVTPLNDMFTDEVTSDLFPALVEEAQVGEDFVGMPVWTNSEILFYRTDLFEDPAEKAAFKDEYGYDLDPPTTWEQYQDVAQFFTRDTDGDGQTDLYGTDVKGAVETEWLATVSQSGAENMVLSPEGDVTVNDADHLAALDFYVGLNNDLKVSPPGAAQIDWAGAQNLFYQGETAMMRFWAHAYPQTPEDSPVAGKIGAAPMIGGPGGVAGVPGPWYLSIPKTTEKQETANEFLQFAYDNNAMGIDSSLGLAARVSAFEEYEGKPGYEHFDALVETLSAEGTKPRPATENWQEIVDSALIPMLQKALEPGADNQQLLDDAKEQIEAIVQ